MSFAPVFEKDNSEFLLAYQDMTREDMMEAHELGKTMEDAQGVTYGFRYSGGVVPTKDLTGCSARLGDLDIVLLSGPYFDRACGKSDLE